MKKSIAFLLTFFLIGFLHAEKPDLLQYVNTLQGSYNTPEFSHGRCSPLVGYPHGETFWTPKGAAISSGNRGGMVIYPVLGKPENPSDAGKQQILTTQPHYFETRFQNGIHTEITSTERCGCVQITFPKNQKAYLIFEGMVIPQWDESSKSLSDANASGYLYASFNQAALSTGTVTTGEGSAKKMLCYLEFPAGSTVIVKLSLSAIHAKQAQITFEREIAPYTFQQVKERAFKAWNDLLNQIVVEGGTLEQRKTFYSCLFRANLRPGNDYEVDKEGKPHFTYEGKVHDGYYHSNPILWDAFRCLLPLQNILNTEGQKTYVQSLVKTKPLTGWWPSGHIMIGNHAISVLADAWAKGIRTFDPDSVLKYYYHEITHSKLDSINNREYNIDHVRGYGRMGFEDYFALGYIPYPKNTNRVMETTSKTLEYNYDDFCAYRLAQMTGNKFYEDLFRKHLYNYKNLFDPADHFFKGRDQEGNWDKKFNPYEWGGPFVEGNGWQWKFVVPHDAQGLVDLIGGDKSFAKELDELFEVRSDSVLNGGYGFRIHEINEAVAGGQGQYAQGNEPCFHVIYLYDYVGQPWKCQKLIRQSLTQLFNSGPKGFPGDEDGGAMSAWYVFSAMGFYPVTPGVDQYALGSPLFDKVTINLENGKKFTILANKNSAENRYIQSATLNGTSWSKNWINHSDLMKGGILNFEMSKEPNTQRGILKEDRPYSVSTNK